MLKRLFVLSTVVVGALLISGPALACSALIGPRGSVELGRTTTLAGYWGGKEHYVTAFNFAGGGGKFGSIVPLPGIPDKVERGGDWTLQRLIRETAPPAKEAFALQTTASGRDSAREVYTVRVDALDITVLEGGGPAVGLWAKEHGFLLPPDSPAVLDFYAKRSKIFMAAVFDADAARERGQEVGDGTPVHLTIPVKTPWVPLRILGLGKPGADQVEADIYLLTPSRPALLPIRAPGFDLERRVVASESLLADLRSDKGMESLPAKGMWLTHFIINSNARDLKFDLATDITGAGKPSYVAAGLMNPAPSPSPSVEAVPSPEPSPLPSPITDRPVAKSEIETSNGWILVAAIAMASVIGSAVAFPVISRLRGWPH